MQYCNIPIIFSYITISYFLTSIVYLILTKNIGTPFKNSLTKEQIIIKKASSQKRFNIFFYTFISILILLFIIQPFRKC